MIYKSTEHITFPKLTSWRKVQSSCIREAGWTEHRQSWHGYIVFINM